MIYYGISKKQDGKMNSDSQEAISNREKFLSKENLDVNRIVLAKLCHGNKVEIVTESDAGKRIEGTDGLITDQNNLILSLTVGDCLPIYIYDQTNQVIGLAHAGWRGVVGNIVSNIISKMVSNFETTVSDMEIYIGPHIQKYHFEIQNDILDNFQDYKDYVIYRGDKTFVDLAGIVQTQATSLKVPSSNISVSPVCTYEDTNYFSYRRDPSFGIKSQLAYIVI